MEVRQHSLQREHWGQRPESEREHMTLEKLKFTMAELCMRRVHGGHGGRGPLPGCANPRALSQWQRGEGKQEF